MKSPRQVKNTPPGRQVALLRGINVGRAKRVAMADLRALIEGLGYSDVRTLLNSGNVVFTATRTAPQKAAASIERTLASELGVTARVTVLTVAELAQVVSENPLGKIASDPSRLLVAVLADPADRSKLSPLSKEDWGDDKLAVGTRVAYVWCAEGVLESRLMQAVQRALGDAVTARNWSTMTKLLALAEA
jgi:uncharacterized protein (DUF1697 family)